MFTGRLILSFKYCCIDGFDPQDLYATVSAQNYDSPFLFYPLTQPHGSNANKVYEPGDFVVTIDGFMITPNITVTESKVIDTGFKYSDHNPVYMDFILETY